VTPFLVPLSLIALVIGIFASRNVRATQAPSSKLYALSLFMYGIMMTSAMFADSLLGGWINGQAPHGVLAWAKFLIAWVDVTLTSSIAVSFFFNGLSDLGKLNEDSKTARVVMFGTYVAIGIAWFYALWINWLWAFPILYLLLVFLACSGYVLCELIYLCRGNARGLGHLIAAGAFGLLGLLCLVMYPPKLCIVFTSWWGNSEWWFFFSNCAVWSVYQYFMANRTPTRPSPRSDAPSGPTESSAAVELEPIYAPRA